MSYGMVTAGRGKLIAGHEKEKDLWSKKEKYNATETQLSLAWLMRHPAGLFPLLEQPNPDRIKESAAATEINIDRQDWFEMLKIASGKDVAWSTIFSLHQIISFPKYFRKS